LIAGLTLVHCPTATSVCGRNAPMPSAADSSVPLAGVIRCLALRVSKQYQGRPRAQERHRPHTARQFRITKSLGAVRLGEQGKPAEHAEHHQICEP
jgi:hypothetical protein